MKRKTTAYFFFIWVCTTLFGSDATIEKVVTFANESKSSVVVYYSGTEQLQFFALDAADGVFSLDLPGVFSKFDFSTLELSQVKQVKQVPLDPDLSNGISVRFFLNEGVSYQIFEGGPGTLTLFFEGDETIEVASLEPPEPEALPVVETESEPVEEVAQAPVQAPPTRLQKTVVGASGNGRFSEIAVDAGQNGGKVFLTVGGDVDFSHFVLDSPPRFVLDLRETIMALSHNKMQLDHPLVHRIRIHQFQSHPEPVTRLVLDLVDEANVRVVPWEQGLMIAFADTSETLATLLEDTSPNHEAESMVADAPVQPEADETLAPAEAVAGLDEEQQPVLETEADSQAETLEVADLPEPNKESMPSAEVAMTEEADLEPQATLDNPVVADEPETTESLLVEDSQDETLAQASDVSATENTEEVTLSDSALEESSTPMDVPAQDSSLELQAEQLVMVADKSDAAAAPVKQEATEPFVEDIAPVELSEHVVAEDSVPSPDPAPVTMADTTLKANETDPFFEEMKDDLGVFEPGNEGTDEPAFVMASDIDLELEEFTGGSDGSIYDMMKGTLSNRTARGDVVVTNSNISAKKKLGEASDMQDETGENADFEELFKEDDDPFEVIGEDEPKYRGFDIVIDIREQPVLDLLRFLADEVGFNLYVDNSVQDIKATYKFRNIPWDQALDIILTNANLDKEFRNGVLRVATTEQFAKEEEARRNLQLERELSVPTETVTVELNYAKAKDVAYVVTEYLSPRGSLIWDERTNTLIIRDIPQAMVEIRTLINRLDKQIAQVTIEARIVETTTRFLRELGIQWGLGARYSPENGTETGIDFPHRLDLSGPRIGQERSPLTGPEGGYAVNFPIVAENPSGFGLTLGNFLDNFKLDISMQLLESEGQGQIISSPKITTQNNRTAIITSGSRIPIQTVQRGTVTTTFVDAVLELQVTPHITADETIILDVVVDKSEPDFTRAAGVGGNPIINVSRAETQVLVKNGGTAVIGGIFSLTEQLSKSGIPKLRNVPVLRRLFGNEQKQYSNQELLIFVTPKIVKY
jgi:type IV pilus assembly protein PilQ